MALSVGDVSYIHISVTGEKQTRTGSLSPGRRTRVPIACGNARTVLDTSIQCIILRTRCNYLLEIRLSTNPSLLERRILLDASLQDSRQVQVSQNFDRSGKSQAHFLGLFGPDLPTVIKWIYVPLKRSEARTSDPPVTLVVDSSSLSHLT